MEERDEMGMGGRQGEKGTHGRKEKDVGKV